MPTGADHARSHSRCFVNDLTAPREGGTWLLGMNECSCGRGGGCATGRGWGGAGRGGWEPWLASQACGSRRPLPRPCARRACLSSAVARPTPNAPPPQGQRTAAVCSGQAACAARAVRTHLGAGLAEVARPRVRARVAMTGAACARESAAWAGASDEVHTLGVRVTMCNIASRQACNMLLPPGLAPPPHDSRSQFPRP